MRADVIGVFREEAAALVNALQGLQAADWERPTRCEPWQVRDLLGHLVTTVGRTTAMIEVARDNPATPNAERASEVTATGYYRADERFSDDANAERVRVAADQAALTEPADLVAELADVCGQVAALSERQAPDLVVVTRHGDPMPLTEFLTTRVVELAVHGIDLADAVPRAAWLTMAATQHLLALMFGPSWRSAVSALGWDPQTVIRKATGRALATEEELSQLDSAGLRRLTLG